MAKRTFRKNLIINVDPSHRLIIDDSDNTKPGRVTLTVDNTITTTNDLRISPSPAPSSLAFTPELSTGTTPSTLPSAPQSSSQSLLISDIPMLTSSPLPTLAERRRRSSSAASHPSLPAPLRHRTDSTTTQSRPPSIRGGRAEEDGFATRDNTTVGLAAPEPYLNGPIQILPGIWLGCEDNARDFASLKRCGIGYVLNVAKEITNIFGNEPEERKRKTSLGPLGKVRSQVPSTPLPFGQGSTRSFHPADPSVGRPDIHYLHLPWSHGQSDLVSNGFPAAMVFTDEAIKRGKGVLIHCQCGVSRSATLVIALVMRAAYNPDAVDDIKELKGSMQAAYNYVKDKSIAVGPNMSLMYQLLEYERHLAREANGQSADEAAQLSEEASIRSEEEEWGRRRKQMEEEEEREREERERGIQSAIDDSTTHLAPHEHSHHHHQPPQWGTDGSTFNRIPEITVKSYGMAPWTAGGSTAAWNAIWNGHALQTGSSGAAGSGKGRASSLSGASIVSGPADDEEARDLDRQMEERMEVRRKSSVASFASSAAPSIAPSVTSASAASSASGGASSTGVQGFPNPSSSGAPWKSRYGGHRPPRIRAGSIDSNFTGRSMVSLEEEEEEDESQLEQHPPQASTANVDVVMEVNDSHERERTVSASTRSSFPASGLSADESESASEPFTSPPLDSDVDMSKPAPFTFPKQPVTHLSLPPAKRPSKKQPSNIPLHNQLLKPMQDVKTSDSTPRAKRSLVSITSSPLTRSPQMMDMALPDLDNTPVQRPSSEIHKPPPAFRRLSTNGLPFATSSSTTSSSLTPPPPSAPPTKMSFGEIPLPSPRRKPSGSSSRSSQSGKIGLGAPPPRPESTVKVKPSKKHTPGLEAVPPSPVQPVSAARSTPLVAMDESLNSPMVNMFVRNESKSKSLPVESPPTKPSASITPLTSMLNAASRKRSASSSVAKAPSPLNLPDPKKRPAPLPLQPPANEPMGLSYILASSKRPSHRSSSSVSSISSSSSRSSQSSLRNKLLGRFIGGRSASPPPSHSTPITATPHQTLFIFPPSPTNSHGKPGTQTPSTLTVTTTTANAASMSSSPYSSVLTPTPTLTSFRVSRAPSFSGKGSLPNPSTMPAASVAAVSGGMVAPGGWMGSAAMAPTTACSRVDVRGWVGI